MGDCLVHIYRNKIKSTWKLAFYSTVIFGFLVHMFRFTNVFLNGDALYNQLSSQHMVQSGRWFLSIACGLSSWFDLPWVIGVLSLVFMGLTAAVITELFDLKRPCVILLGSLLLASFPSVTATFAFMFTADGYMLAMLLAAVSVYLCRVNQVSLKNWKQLAASSICICLACGIYQAYVSFAFILAVCYFVSELLENRYSRKEYLRWIGANVVIYGCAMAAYYVIWQLSMRLGGIEPSGYQGIGTAGVEARNLLSAAVGCVKSFVLYFLENNFVKFGLTRYAALNALFLVALVAGALIAAFKTGCFQDPFRLVLLVLCAGSLPFGCYLWNFVSREVSYHALMLQCMFILFFFAAILFDRWTGPKLSNLVLLLLCVISINNAVNTNVFYKQMFFCYERTYATTVELSTRIHLLDDGTIRDILFVGDYDSFDVHPTERESPLYNMGGLKMLHHNVVSPLFLSQFTDFKLSYYRDNNLEYPLVELEENAPVPAGWEFRFPLTQGEKATRLTSCHTVKYMPEWPAAGSVQTIGDTIIVKFSEADRWRALPKKTAIDKLPVLY